MAPMDAPTAILDPTTATDSAAPARRRSPMLLLTLAFLVSVAALIFVYQNWRAELDRSAHHAEEQRTLQKQIDAKDTLLSDVRSRAAQFEQELALEHAKTNEAQNALQALKDDSAARVAALEKQLQQAQQDLDAARKAGEKPQPPPAPPAQIVASTNTPAQPSSQSDLERQLQHEKEALQAAEKALSDAKKADADALKKEKTAREKAEKDAKDQSDAAQKARAETAAAEKTISDLHDQIRKLNSEIDHMRAQRKHKQ